MSDPYGTIALYGKGGCIMSSFLEDVNQMVIDACYQDIAEQLLENWINSNLEEGQYYADKQFAWMSDDKFVQSEFNKFYNLTEIDEDYFEIL
jgi:hypothetical protein